jgi:hypothetical protein
MRAKPKPPVTDLFPTRAGSYYWPSWILIPLAGLLGVPGGYAYVELFWPRAILWMLPLPCIMVAIIGARISSVRQTLLIAAAYSLGTTTFPMIEALLRPGPFWNPGAAGVLGAVHFSINGTLCAGVWWFLWGRPRKLNARRRFLCDNCSYNLVGNTSGVCPECGTPIAFADKGITPQQLRTLAQLDDDMHEKPPSRRNGSRPSSHGSPSP